MEKNGELVFGIKNGEFSQGIPCALKMVLTRIMHFEVMMTMEQKQIK